MNATGGGMFDAPSLGGVGYGISVFVGILFLISTVTLASYFCTRSRSNHPPPSPPPPRGGDGTEGVDVEAHPAAELGAGIDEATLKGYPRLVYSRSSTSDQAAAAAAAAADDASCCAICLADYKDADVLRLLPDCKHRFHLKCVDPWLRRHPTCPVCRRTSPLPSPLPTPLAEVVPLARRYS